MTARKCNCPLTRRAKRAPPSPTRGEGTWPIVRAGAIAPSRPAREARAALSHKGRGNELSGQEQPSPTRGEGTGLIVQEGAELARARGVLQFPERLGFDLADAFARDRELLAHFFQRVIGVHADAEAHAKHALFARGERGQ